jgi:RNA-directed DNA polymerase
MNVEQSMCAASGPETQWEQVNWSRCELKVRRLQARIVKATQEGRHGKVKALQWLLTHSFQGRALAVKRVTHNQGKNTPGAFAKGLKGRLKPFHGILLFVVVEAFVVNACNA